MQFQKALVFPSDFGNCIVLHHNQFTHNDLSIYSIEISHWLGDPKPNIYELQMIRYVCCIYVVL